MEQPLGVELDKRNAGRLRYPRRSLIPSFGLTWCLPRPWYCNPHTYRAAGLLQDGTSPQPSPNTYPTIGEVQTENIGEHRISPTSNIAVVVLKNVVRSFRRGLCALVRCIPLTSCCKPRPTKSVIDHWLIERRISVAPLSVSLSQFWRWNESVI